MTTDARVCLTCPNTIDASAAEYIKMCMDCFKDDTKRRACKVCKKLRIFITEPDWKTVCSTCFSDAEKRPCASCKETVIPSYEPPWRSLCSTCFSNPALFKKCVDCGELKIKPGYPDYVTRCTDCYQINRRSTHEQCPECLVRGNTRLTKLKGKRLCAACLKEQRGTKRKAP